MNQLLRTFKACLGCLIVMSLLLGLSSPPAFGQYPLLKRIIAAQNLKNLEESVLNGSYRGEAGILRISPEVGESLGIRALVNQDYHDAMALLEKAGESLEKVRTAMATEKTEDFPGQHAEQIAEHFLCFRAASQIAEEKLKAYRSKLNPSNDERLNETTSDRIMEQLLLASLKKTENNLRDALGHFYNLCRGMNSNDDHLTPKNVIFVNHVFNQFVHQSSEDRLRAFNLDRHRDYRGEKTDGPWKSAIDFSSFHYIEPLEAVLRKSNNKTSAIDPLLFIALMRRESNFDHLAVSSVGAAGLTQIMPQTALHLGMQNIFRPAYYREAAKMLERERKARRQAWAVLNEMNQGNKVQNAKQARSLAQKALVYGRKKERLYLKYKTELLKMLSDDRLKPALAIEYGFEYFAQLMKAQKGDVSLALAAYNAGPGRVKLYNGIPPFEETVRFRNKVLEFYREYLEQLKQEGKE
jgi:hypothetical protein